MLCGEGGHESGCACSGFGGVGRSASGGREKNYHNILRTPLALPTTQVQLPNININQLLLITPLPVQQLSPSPPAILFDYGYGCEGGGRLLVVVVTY